ncbi:flagellar hook-length control protein FliK [Niallia sp. Krafla_26]|uniref:flagellar hook-length control protein FliK n=1 Tax=Niallia sp. Krafla_26 TaxID=3064703 RepID=UPI003D18046F
MRMEGIDFATQTLPKQKIENHESKIPFSTVISSLFLNGENVENSKVDAKILNDVSLSDEELMVLHKLLNHEDVVNFLNIVLEGNNDGSIRIEEELKIEDLANLFQQTHSNAGTNNEDLLFIVTQFLTIFNLYNKEIDQHSNPTNTKLLNLQDLDIEQPKLLAIVQKVSEKIEILLKQKEPFNRNEYVNQVFSAVVKDTKEQNPSLNRTFAIISNDHVIQQKIMYPNQMTLVHDQSNKSISTEQLIRQFESILAKSQFVNQSPGAQKLFIKLYPEHLGALRIELLQKESGLIAKFMTTTTIAKEILESQLQNLKHAFHSQNIQVERLEISSQLNFQERFNSRDSQQQQEQRQQQQEEHQQENETFQESFAEILINEEI